MKSAWGTLVFLFWISFPAEATTPPAASPSVVSPPATQRLTPSREIVLSAFQMKSLSTDLPAADLFFDGEKALWVLGRTALWRWDFLRNALKKIPLVKPAPRGADEASLQKIGTDGALLYAASGRELFRIEFDPERVLRFPNPVSGRGETLGFAGGGDNFWWVHTSGIFFVDRYGKTLANKFPRNGLLAADHVFFDAVQKKLWIARGKKLLAINEGASGTPQVVMDAKNRFVDLVSLGAEGFMALTAFTALRFDPQGELRQTVPVEGSRKLIAMAVARPTLHAYLFQDGLCEVMDVGRKTVTSLKFEMGRVKDVRALVTAPNRVAFLADGTPRLFFMAGAAGETGPSRDLQPASVLPE